MLAHLPHPIEEISCDDENEKYVGAVIQNGQDGERPFKKVAKGSQEFIHFLLISCSQRYTSGSEVIAVKPAVERLARIGLFHGSGVFVRPHFGAGE